MNHYPLFSFLLILLSILLCVESQATWGGFYVHEDYKCSTPAVEVRAYKTGTCIEIDTADGDSSFFKTTCENNNSLLYVYNCTDNRCTNCVLSKFTANTCASEDDNTLGFIPVCSNSYPSIGTQQPVQNIFYNAFGCPDVNAFEYVGISTDNCIATGVGFIAYECNSANNTVSVKSCSDDQCKINCTASNIKNYCTTVNGGSAYFGCGKTK